MTKQELLEGLAKAISGNLETFKTIDSTLGEK
jgi:hypothetical protein